MNAIQETIRAEVKDIVGLKAVAVYFAVSQFKSNWMKFILGRTEPVVTYLKKKGALVKLLTPTMVEVHVSLTRLTNKELQDLGIVAQSKQFCNNHAVELAEAGFGGLEVHAVREGLMLVRVGAEKYLVLERKPEEVYDEASVVVKMLYNFSHQWVKWAATATVIEVEGKEVLKFENGLSIRMEMTESTYCNVRWNGESYDLSTPYEFYWWLKKFF